MACPRHGNSLLQRTDTPVCNAFYPHECGQDKRNNGFPAQPNTCVRLYYQITQSATKRHKKRKIPSDAGRLDEAIDLFERTLADCERVLGPKHPQTELFRNRLAAAYWAAERPEDARALLGPLPDIDGTGAGRTGD